MRGKRQLIVLFFVVTAVVLAVTRSAFADSVGLVTQFTFSRARAPALGAVGLLACVLLLLVIGARRSAGHVP